MTHNRTFKNIKNKRNSNITCKALFLIILLTVTCIFGKGINRKVWGKPLRSRLRARMSSRFMPSAMGVFSLMIRHLTSVAAGCSDANSWAAVKLHNLIRTLSDGVNMEDEGGTDTERILKESKES